MHKKIRTYINRNKLFSVKNDKIILAISGGADSVCLMHILLYLGVNIELAHCNFRLRKEESNKDENFVRSLASTFSLKLHCKSFRTKYYAVKNKLSIQMAARDLRYSWLNSLLQDKKADYIATAHHLDDSIETFFINLIRGSGITGLKGISCKNKNIIRPLLDCSREDIEGYLSRRKLIYREDSSNISKKYLRNNIRHKLIPLLKEFNPNIQETILSEMKILKDTFIVFSNHIQTIKEKIITEKEEIISIDISQIRELFPLRIYLFELLRPYGFNQTESIISALDNQSGKKFYSRNYELVLNRGKILIKKYKEDNYLEIQITPLDNHISYPFNLKFSTCLNTDIIHKEHIAQLDFQKLRFPLNLRRWRDGDKFKPLGMNTFKKLSDFFIDNKFSVIEKQKQWLLCSGNDIVWVVGYRIDERYKVNSKTKKLYIAEIL